MSEIHLPFADSIIVLDAHGQLVEQGSYKAIIAQGLHIQPERTPADCDSTHESEDSLADDAESIDDPERELRLLKRSHNRDRDVYLFYFRNVGWPLMGLYILLAIGFMTALNFPREWF